jgi:hypothetical protein
MFAAKDSGAVERPFGEAASARKVHSYAELGAERETTVDQVGYRLPCLLLGAFLV